MTALYLDDPRDTLKAVRETLCLAQSAVDTSPSADPHLQRMSRIIAEIDRQRPLGPDGTHGGRHTGTCGCEDKDTDKQPAPKRWADEEPHSRACGLKPHAHGLGCKPDCPTCGGGLSTPEPAVQEACQYCHGLFPFPVALHHDEEECEKRQAAHNAHTTCGVVIADIPGDVQTTRSTAKDGSEWSQEWRQVAWYGLSTGIAYNLRDEARLREDGAGFGGLWILAHNDRVEKPDPEDENAPDAAEFAAMQREAIVPCGNAANGLPISECQKRPEGCVCFPAEPQGDIEKMAYWTRRILDNDGALTADSSMDLDMAHDELTKAARSYLGLAEIGHVDVDLNTDRGAVSPIDHDLPGMWSHSDFEGGDPDTRGYAQRERDAQAHESVDSEIRRAAQELDRIYSQRTAGDYTFVGMLHSFLTRVDWVRGEKERAEAKFHYDAAMAMQGDRLTEWVAVCPKCWDIQDGQDPLRGAVSPPVSTRRLALQVARSHIGDGHVKTFAWAVDRLTRYNADSPLLRRSIQRIAVDESKASEDDDI